MRTIWVLSLAVCLGALRLHAASPEAPALPEDWRVTRDLQQKAYGAPELGAEPGATGDLLLGAAQLGAVGAPMGSMKNQDYDALYAMLQRYRDELVGLGLDYDKLMTRLDSLRQQADSLKDRLDKYHPLDGAKIHGRVSAMVDSFGIRGKRAVPVSAGPYYAGPVGVSKPANVGLRYVTGFSRGEVNFEFTRGIASGMLGLDMNHVWTSDTINVQWRREWIEIRTPIVMQFGTMNTNLSPLTLWRNEDQFPFEPEPYRSRRERAREAYRLVPDKWELVGIRLSTDMELFNTVKIGMESITSIVGQTNQLQPYAVYYLSTTSEVLMSVHTTYMEAWRIKVPTPVGLRFAYQGVWFGDDNQSRPNTKFHQFDALAHSVSGRFESGPFFVDAEYGLSSLTVNRNLTATARNPLTGTAMTGSVGMKGDWGHLKLFGRAVSNGYHAAGAQGRTQDSRYELLGPLLTETSYVRGDSYIGFPEVPQPPQSRWNTHFVPPSVYRKDAGNNLFATGSFGHLLPYNFLANMSPYGQATPNRQGFGTEAELRLWGRLLVPKASYEMASESDGVPDAANNTTIAIKPFTFQQIRAGLDINFHAFWDWKLTGGWTFNDTRNGDVSKLKDMNGNFVAYALTSNLYEAGLELKTSETLAWSVGHRHLLAVGLSEAELVSRLKEVGYDSLAYGVRWDITPVARFDMLYETFWFSNPEAPLQEYDGDAGILRMSVVY